MFYFVCEGEKDKAEYSFVSRLIELYNYNNSSFKLIALNGNKNIQGKVDSIIKDNCVSGDTLVLFFDNIESINGIVVYDLLNSFITSCMKKGVCFRYTTYYCFEELFLSYDKLLDLIRNDLHKSLVGKIQQCIMSGSNYIDCLDSIEISKLNKLLSLDITKTTRETISASLLSVVTNVINGKFHISKDEIEDCWLYSCKDLSLPYKCNRCNYPIKDILSKIKDLDNNSVSKFSCPFSTLFD